MAAKKKSAGVEEAGQAAVVAVKARLEALIEHWRRVMALGDYELNVGWNAPPRAAAEIKADGVYLQAGIQFNIGNILTKHSAEETEDLVVHELAHLILHPLEQELSAWVDRAADAGVEFSAAERKQYNRIVENTTVRIQRAISNAAETGRCGGCLGT